MFLQTTSSKINKKQFVLFRIIETVMLTRINAKAFSEQLCDQAKILFVLTKNFLLYCDLAPASNCYMNCRCFMWGHERSRGSL